MEDRQINSVNNNSLNADELEAFEREYQAGQLAFERGRYREAVHHLEVASALVVGHAGLNGDVQIWLVTAYEAVGQCSDAIALCKKMTQHPSLEIRQQSLRRYVSLCERKSCSRRVEQFTPRVANVGEVQTPFHPCYA